MLPAVNVDLGLDTIENKSSSSSSSNDKTCFLGVVAIFTVVTGAGAGAVSFAFVGVDDDDDGVEVEVGAGAVVVVGADVDGAPGLVAVETVGFVDLATIGLAVGTGGLFLVAASSLASKSSSIFSRAELSSGCSNADPAAAAAAAPMGFLAPNKAVSVLVTASEAALVGEGTKKSSMPLLLAM